MLGLRRASTLFRGFQLCRRENRSSFVGATTFCSVKLDHVIEIIESSAPGKALPSLTVFPGTSSPGGSLLRVRHISSHAGEKSDDEEDGFSELDVPPVADRNEEMDCKVEESLLSKPANVEEEASGSVSDSEEEIDSMDTEADNDKADTGATSSLSKIVQGSLVEIVMNAPIQSVGSALDRFVEDGHTLGRSEISLAIQHLRRRRIYGKALKICEWLEVKEPFQLSERDYASHVDLIGKLQGSYKAEKYIETIPEEHRGEIVYRTLLASCVSAGNLKKSEVVFNKMKDMGFPLTAFVCNQLILLYKKLDRKKIADILLMMENEDVKANNFTYKLLIEIKGRSKDMDGMEQVVGCMKAEGMELDMYILSDIARYYILGGCNEKAEAVLKEIEGVNIKENRAACKLLIPLFAALDRADDVERMWDVCKQNPNFNECVAAIESWGKLGHIENAEAVFERMKKVYGKKLHSNYSIALLGVYADHKLVTKGKELVEQMSISGNMIRPAAWDALVKLYVGVGEVEKADSLLEKFSGQSDKLPMYSSYLSLLENYANRGDIHNTEKIFDKIRSSVYTGRVRSYQLLLEAYIRGKTPAYGFRERMKADNIFPNYSVLAQLKTLDAVKKSKNSLSLA